MGKVVEITGIRVFDDRHILYYKHVDRERQGQIDITPEQFSKIMDCNLIGGLARFDDEDALVELGHMKTRWKRG